MENTIEIIDLDALRNRAMQRKTSFKKNELRINVVPGQNYYISFSKELSQLFDSKKMTRLNLAKNNLTGEIFAVISEKSGYQMTLKNKYKNRSFNCSISNKTVVFEVLKRFDIDGESITQKSVFHFILSENLSSNPEFMTFKIKLTES